MTESMDISIMLVYMGLHTPQKYLEKKKNPNLFLLVFMVQLVIQMIL